MVSITNLNKIQIMNLKAEQEFLDGLRDEMVEWGMNNIGSDYETVSIIGSQSSEKITLLNNMFETDFTVMDPKVRGRSMTGIWLSARDKAHNVIVMDVEGSDGGSLGDEQNFERKCALFALACSRTVIVKLWDNQVGLGANMGLLKIVFEEHLSLYGNLTGRLYQSPKIIFIIQAHCSGISLENLADKITQDLNKIWDSIQKPKKFRNKTIEDCFDFKFESLPHKLMASEKCRSPIGLLRGWLGSWRPKRTAVDDQKAVGGSKKCDQKSKTGNWWVKMLAEEDVQPEWWVQNAMLLILRTHPLGALLPRDDAFYAVGDVEPVAHRRNYFE